MNNKLLRPELKSEREREREKFVYIERSTKIKFWMNGWVDG